MKPQKHTMRTAPVAALVAAVVAALAQAQTTEPAPPSDPQPVVQSPRATIPVSPQNIVPPTGTPPPAAETDPAKLASPVPSPDARIPGAVPVPADSYIIGAQDVLSIQVWGMPALSGTVLVRPDSVVSVGLVGEMKAAGLTPDQLTQEITKRLKEEGLVKDPRVTVAVTQINSRMVDIIGEVGKPGRYPLIVPTTVLQALVNAGSFKDFANQKNIIIQRGDRRLKFNYKRVIAGKDRNTNIQLEPGDIIIVK